MDQKDVEINQLVEALMLKIPREHVIETLNQLLNMPKEDMDELAEYCRMIDEREKNTSLLQQKNT
ncbi:hypothetical protein WAX74_15130 [Psychrobacillus sp. FJAT-51614]|uniref:Uncharacterized protein n=1 Tax=Psychrobacillus mangrovi TaxID=3117745 RepID=A0ABU8F7G5_9BACI